MNIGLAKFIFCLEGAGKYVVHDIIRIFRGSWDGVRQRVEKDKNGPNRPKTVLKHCIPQH